jgi:hypothetical protein
LALFNLEDLLSVLRKGEIVEVDTAVRPKLGVRNILHLGVEGVDDLIRA